MAQLPVATGLVAAVNERLQVQGHRCIGFSQRHRKRRQSLAERTIVNLTLVRMMSFPDNDQIHRLRRRFPEFGIQLIRERSETATNQIDFDNVDATSNKLFMTHRQANRSMERFVTRAKQFDQGHEVIVDVANLQPSLRGRYTDCLRLGERKSRCILLKRNRIGESKTPLLDNSHVGAHANFRLCVEVNGNRFLSNHRQIVRQPLAEDFADVSNQRRMRVRPTGLKKWVHTRQKIRDLHEVKIPNEMPTSSSQQSH